jgi:hypothetical protein
VATNRKTSICHRHCTVVIRPELASFLWVDETSRRVI